MVGAPASNGTAYLLYGPLASGTTALTASDVTFTGASSEAAGWSVASAGDLDADGYDDVVLGAYLAYDMGDGGYGQAYVFQGPVAAGMHPTSSADSVFRGEGGANGAGYAVAGAGDVNADGNADLMIGAWQAGDFTTTGRAYIVDGPVPSGQTGLSSADVTITAEYDSYRTGCSVAGAGDVDGDGVSDVLVGSFRSAWLLLGPLAGTVSLGTANAEYSGESIGQYAGSTVAAAGDVNDDGHDDVIIGAYGNDSGGADAGRGYIFLGSGSPTDTAMASADTQLVGSAGHDEAGYSVAGV